MPLPVDLDLGTVGQLTIAVQAGDEIVGYFTVELLEETVHRPGVEQGRIQPQVRMLAEQLAHGVQREAIHSTKRRSLGGIAKDGHRRLPTLIQQPT